MKDEHNDWLNDVPVEKAPVVEAPEATQVDSGEVVNGVSSVPSPAKLDKLLRSPGHKRAIMWGGFRDEYLHTDLPVTELCKKYGIGHSTAHLHIKRNRWDKLRREMAGVALGATVRRNSVLIDQPASADLLLDKSGNNDDELAEFLPTKRERIMRKAILLGEQLINKLNESAMTIDRGDIITLKQTVSAFRDLVDALNRPLQFDRSASIEKQAVVQVNVMQTVMEQADKSLPKPTIEVKVVDGQAKKDG